MNLDEMLVRAKFSIKIRDYDLAIKLLNKIALEQPNVPGLYLLLGNCYQAVKLYDDANNNYQLAIKKDPKLIEAYNNLGVISKVKGDFETALKYFKEASALDTKRADILYNIGNVYKSLNRANEAINFYRKSIVANPEYDLPYNNIGTVYLELGRHEEAINAYLQGIKIDPNNIRLHYNLGVIYEQLEKYEEAIIHYKKAIENNPNYIEAHNNLGVIYEKLGNTEEARNCYEDVLTLDNNYIKAKNNLALLHEKQGNETEAIKLYNEALAIDPNYKMALKNVGRAYKNIGKYFEAENVYEKLLNIDDTDKDVLFSLAKVEEKLNVNNSIDIYKKCLKLDPGNIEIRKSISTLYSNLGRNEEAMDELKTIDKMIPTDTDNKMKMARLAHDNGDAVEAIRILQSLLATKPDNKDALFFLGTLFLDNGEPKKAVEVFEKLNELFPGNSWIIYNLANAYKNDKKEDKALSIIEPFLKVEESDGVSFDSSVDVFNKYFKVYEDTVQQQFQDDDIGKLYRDKLQGLDFDDIDGEKQAETTGVMESDFDSASSIDYESTPIINIGDLEPDYSVFEEDEVVTLSDGDEDEEDEEMEDIKNTSILGLLDDKEVYNDRLDGRKLTFDDEKDKADAKPRFNSNQENKAPPLPEPPQYPYPPQQPQPSQQPYQPQQFPQYNENSVSSQLENKLGDLIDKISEKFANDNRKEEPVPQKKPKPEFKDEHKDDPEVFGPYYDLLDDYENKEDVEDGLDEIVKHNEPPEDNGEEEDDLMLDIMNDLGEPLSSMNDDLLKSMPGINDDFFDESFLDQLDDDVNQATDNNLITDDFEDSTNTEQSADEQQNLTNSTPTEKQPENESGKNQDFDEDYGDIDEEIKNLEDLFDTDDSILNFDKSADKHFDDVAELLEETDTEESLDEILEFDDLEDIPDSFDINKQFDDESGDNDIKDNYSDLIDNVSGLDSVEDYLNADSDDDVTILDEDENFDIPLNLLDEPFNSIDSNEDSGTIEDVVDDEHENNKQSDTTPVDTISNEILDDLSDLDSIEDYVNEKPGDDVTVLDEDESFEVPELSINEPVSTSEPVDNFGSIDDIFDDNYTNDDIRNINNEETFSDNTDSMPASYLNSDNNNYISESVINTDSDKITITTRLINGIEVDFFN